MNGWEQASLWLLAYGTGWTIRGAETTLTPGPMMGTPTTRLVVVRLGYEDDPALWLEGSGESMLAAVKNAVGGLVNAQGIPMEEQG